MRTKPRAASVVPLGGLAGQPENVRIYMYVRMARRRSGGADAVVGLPDPDRREPADPSVPKPAQSRSRHDPRPAEGVGLGDGRSYGRDGRRATAEAAVAVQLRGRSRALERADAGGEEAGDVQGFDAERPDLMRCSTPSACLGVPMALIS